MDAFDRPDGDGDPMDALRKLFKELGLPEDSDVNDSEVRADLLRHMMRRLMPSDGVSDQTVVWETVRQMARHFVSSLGPDPSGNSRTSRQVCDAVHLAELWLSEGTVLPPVATIPAVWSRAEWIEATLPNWKAMIEPVIGILTQAISNATASRMDIQAEGDIAQLQSILQPIMSRAISAIFGAHVGEGLGQAAITTMTGTDLGLPLLDKPYASVLLTNLSAIQQQAELDEEGLLLYCCLREVARQRLFFQIGWIAPQIIALVQHYAREMRVDPDAIASAMEDAVPDHLSPETVAAFQADFSTLFSPGQSEEQREILDRLSTLLALVEGWVDDVTSSVAKTRLPGWEPISESLRRHRATSKPAQAMVTPLIGLNASPKAIREAATFWETIRMAQGVDARDAIWRYPESMPQPSQIADPASFLAKPVVEEDPWDDELRKFLDSDGTGDPNPES